LYSFPWLRASADLNPALDTMQNDQVRASVQRLYNTPEGNEQQYWLREELHALTVISYDMKQTGRHEQGIYSTAHSTVSHIQTDTRSVGTREDQSTNVTLNDTQ